MVPIENADVVHTQEATAEYTAIRRVLLVQPPHRTQGRRAVHHREEIAVARSGAGPVELVDLPAGPCVQRWVGIAERPFVCRDLTVRVLRGGLLQNQDLFFREFRVDQCHCHAMKRRVPGREPGVLPGIRHEDDVADGEVLPVAVATGPARVRRARLARIAFEPPSHVIAVELLAPQQPGERLTLHQPLIDAQIRRGDILIERVGLGFANPENRIGIVKWQGKLCRGEPHRHRETLARGKFRHRVGGGLAALVRVDSRGITVDHVVVDPVLGRCRGVRRSEQKVVIGLVLTEQKIRNLARRGCHRKPALPQFRMICYGNSVATLGDPRWCLINFP